jgi:hypothetical protein
MITALELEHQTETLNRQERAFRLTRLCLQYRLKTHNVETMNEEQWNMLGSAARINLPVGEKTKALVVDLLKLARTPVLAHSKLEAL